MIVTLTRRAFVQRSALALLGTRIAAAPVGLTLHVVLPATRADLLDGVIFGVEEAKRTAALVQSSVDVVMHEAPDDLGAASSGLSAIIGGHDAAGVALLAARAGTRPVLNIAAADDDLRGRHCADAVFHIAPSESMLSGAAREASTAGSQVLAWHPTLYRYGAEQLNDRFRARHRAAPGMSPDAWCGWLSVKVLAESALRSRAGSNADLVAWMSSPRARFDGHKGVALVFDAQRQLRQPLYVVSNDDRVIAESTQQDPAEACP